MSVVDRWAPVETDMNGTLVARPPRMPQYPVLVGSTLKVR